MSNAETSQDEPQKWMYDFVERYDRETADPSWILKKEQPDSPVCGFVFPNGLPEP